MIVLIMHSYSNKFCLIYFEKLYKKWKVQRREKHKLYSILQKSNSHADRFKSNIRKFLKFGII